jgi:hypothetical protein
MPRYKKRKDGRTTVSLADELHEDLRAEAFIKRTTLTNLLDAIVGAHYGRFRGDEPAAAAEDQEGASDA